MTSFAKLFLLVFNASLFSYCLGAVSAVLRSQEVELLIQVLDLLLHLVKANHLLFTRFYFRLSSAAMTRDHEELSDLVGVLAWGGDLNWTGPVVVEMTQGECQLLQLDLGKI
jgi:hypothetical protein